MNRNERKIAEFHSPLEVDPKEQRWGFVGFVRKGDKLFLDIAHTLTGRTQGLIIRTEVNDGYSFKGVNQVINISDNYEPEYAYKHPEYDKKLYDFRKVKLGSKQLSLEQVGTFARLVNDIARQRGLDDLTQEDIFGNEDVKKTLGLDQVRSQATSS